MLADGSRHYRQRATIGPAIDRRGICLRQWQIVYYGHRANARNNRQPIENLPVKFDLPRPRIVFPGGIRLHLRADGNSHCEHMIGVKTSIGALQADQATNQKARARQQQEGESGFGGDEGGKQPSGPSSRYLPGRRAERLDICSRRENQRRQRANARQNDAHRAVEYQHASVQCHTLEVRKRKGKRVQLPQHELQQNAPDGQSSNASHDSQDQAFGKQLRATRQNPAPSEARMAISRCR